VKEKALPAERHTSKFRLYLIALGVWLLVGIFITIITLPYLAKRLFLANESPRVEKQLGYLNFKPINEPKPHLMLNVLVISVSIVLIPILAPVITSFVAGYLLYKVV